MRKKIGVLLIIFGILGIISIIMINNKEEISNKIISAVAQIKNGLIKQQVTDKEGNTKEENEEGNLPIKISYSDLSIDEKITSITKIGDTQEEQNVTGDGKLAKTEINRKKDETTKVKIKYKLTIANEGNSEGTIDNIIVNIPEGMELSQESASIWKISSTNTLEYNDKEEIKEKESKTINLAIEGVASENMGEQKTEALIISSEDADQRKIENETNQKIDTTNAKEKMSETNNYTSSTAIISISTWLKDYSLYLIILLIILVIIGIIMYKKK